MARISYYAIEQAIADQIKNDTDVAAITTNVVVEEAVMMQSSHLVHVSLESREEPAQRQSISAGTRTRVLCHFAVWCFARGLQMPAAIEQRDDLLSAVEVALMKNRHLPFGRNDINTYWIDGGEFESAKDETGFIVGGEISLTVDVTAIR